MHKIVFDTETTVKNKIGDFGGNPFCPENYVVCSGFKRGGNMWLGRNGWPKVYSLDTDHPQQLLPEPFILIGQNIKFDLHYLRREQPAVYAQLKNPINKIYDTQVAEYLISAQRDRMMSLNDLCTKYGLELKHDYMKEFWDNGGQTEDYDRDALIEYMEQDINLTEQVYDLQQVRIDSVKIRPLLELIMGAVLTTAEMEYNGMAINRGALNRVSSELNAAREEIVDRMNEILMEEYPGLEPSDFNLGSPKQLSALIFGGEIEIEREEQVGFFKTGARKGEKKYQKTKYTKYVNLIKATPLAPAGKNGAYSVSEDVLNELNAENPSEFLGLLLQLRWYDKQIGTYCDGVLGMVFPDGLIHHSLNCALTVTGRLSCSQPNMQNIPAEGDSPIKEYFVSRFDGGQIVNIDFSQLEVVWQAFITNDKNMKQDILNGVDFHCKRLAYKDKVNYDDVVQWAKVEERPEWVAKRKKIKAMSFQRSYGAGARAISLSTGIPLMEVKAFIKAEDEMYPELDAFYKKVLHSCETRMRHYTHTTEKGVAAGTGYFQSITGRWYAFKQGDAPDWMIRETGERVSFMPTQLKNYPVQGGATGDMVQIMMYMLYREFIAKGFKSVLINQVHDSIMIDYSPEDNLDDVCSTAKRVLESAPAVLSEYLDIQFDLPLTVDVEYGINWKQQQKWRA